MSENLPKYNIERIGESLNWGSSFKSIRKNPVSKLAQFKCAPPFASDLISILLTFEKYFPKHYTFYYTNDLNNFYCHCRY